MCLSFQEKKALASACAILFGALYPIFRARDELAQQRSLLARINSEVEVSKRKMRFVVEAALSNIKLEECVVDFA